MFSWQLLNWQLENISEYRYRYQTFLQNLIQINISDSQILSFIIWAFFCLVWTCFLSYQNLKHEHILWLNQGSLLILQLNGTLSFASVLSSMNRAQLEVFTQPNLLAQEKNNWRKFFETIRAKTSCSWFLTGNNRAWLLTMHLIYRVYIISTPAFSLIKSKALHNIIVQ